MCLYVCLSECVCVCVFPYGFVCHCVSPFPSPPARLVILLHAHTIATHLFVVRIRTLMNMFIIVRRLWVGPHVFRPEAKGYLFPAKCKMFKQMTDIFMYRRNLRKSSENQSDSGCGETQRLWAGEPLPQNREDPGRFPMSSLF